MPKVLNTKNIKSFGDFQTPKDFSIQVLKCVKKSLPFQPQSILEPTCGKGSFLFAAADVFSTANSYTGVEINKSYIQDLCDNIYNQNIKDRINLVNDDFFYIRLG